MLQMIPLSTRLPPLAANRAVRICPEMEMGVWARRAMATTTTTTTRMPSGPVRFPPP